MLNYIEMLCWISGCEINLSFKGYLFSSNNIKVAEINPILQNSVFSKMKSISEISLFTQQIPLESFQFSIIW